MRSMITGSSQRKWRKYRSHPVHPHKRLQYIPTSFEFPRGGIRPRRMKSSYAEKSPSWNGKHPPGTLAMMTVTSRILCTQLQFSLGHSMPASTFHAVVHLKSPRGIPEPSFHWWHSYSSIDADVPALWRRKSHLRSILMMLIREALVLETSRDILPGAEAEDAAHTEEAAATIDHWWRVERGSHALSNSFHHCIHVMTPFVPEFYWQ